MSVTQPNAPPLVSSVGEPLLHHGPLSLHLEACHELALGCGSSNATGGAPRLVLEDALATPRRGRPASSASAASAGLADSRRGDIDREAVRPRRASRGVEVEVPDRRQRRGDLDGLRDLDSLVDLALDQAETVRITESRNGSSLLAQPLVLLRPARR